MLKVHPDFLTFTYPAVSLAGACSVVNEFLNFSNFKSDFSLESSSNKWIVKSPCGLLAIFKRSKDSLNCRLELQGSFFSGCKDVYAPLHHFYKIKNANLTRLDLALDDYQSVITPLELYQICQDGNFKFFQKYQLIESSLRDSFSFSTLYFGSKSKGSDKLLRIYQAQPLHDLDCIRWELQLRRSRAKVALDLILDSFDKDFELASLIFGSVDFGTFGVNCTNSFKRFEWYQSLIDKLSAIPRKCTAPKPDSSLDTMIAWIRHSCSPSLGVLLRALGSDRFVKFILDASITRMKPEHYSMINYIKENNLLKDI